MSEMIEKMARAMLAEDMRQRREFGMPPELSNDEWEYLSPTVYKMRRNLARAALRELMEPTPEMQAAALPYVIRQSQTREIFRAMIRAAAGESENG